MLVLVALEDQVVVELVVEELIVLLLLTLMQQMVQLTLEVVGVVEQ